MDKVTLLKLLCARAKPQNAFSSRSERDVQPPVSTGGSGKVVAGKLTAVDRTARSWVSDRDAG